MTRILVISTIAFSVASSAWATSGCWKSDADPRPDAVCPAPAFAGYCIIVPDSPEPADLPAELKGKCNPRRWFTCVPESANADTACGGFKPAYNTVTNAARVAGRTVAALVNGDVTTNEVSSAGTDQIGQGLSGVPALDSKTFGTNTRPGVQPVNPTSPEAKLLQNSRVMEALNALAPYRNSDGSLKDEVLNEEAKFLEYRDRLRTLNGAVTSADNALKNDIAAASANRDRWGAAAKSIQDDNAQPDDSYNRNQRPLDTGDCSLSGQLSSDGKMNCGGTRKLIKTSEAMNQAGQIGGAITTQIAGAQAQNSAISAGTQSAALKGAAATQGNAGKTQTLLGAIGAFMGYMQVRAGGKHSDNANDIKKDFNTKNQAGLYVSQTTKDSNLYSDDYNQNGEGNKGYAATAIRNGVDNLGNVKTHQNGAISAAHTRLKEYNSRLNGCSGDQDPAGCRKHWGDMASNQEKVLANTINLANQRVSDAGRTLAVNAAGEQSKVAEEARNAGMLAMLQGAQQIGQGVLNMKAAGQLAEAARKIEDAENDSGLVLTPPGQDVFPSTDPRTPTVITGNGANPNGEQNTASQDQTPTDDGTSPLGGGIAPPLDNAPVGMAPAPGKFNPGGGGGGAGGGGGGGLNGGSTQAASPDGGDKGPTAANPYVAGTTPVSGGGGMVGPPAQGAKDQGLNPADMLAQALGLNKPQEKDPTSQAYAGGRGPASQGGMGMGLGMPDDDIFKMIEGSYRRQIKAGNIGG